MAKDTLTREVERQLNEMVQRSGISFTPSIGEYPPGKISYFTTCEDGWLIAYTTARALNGKHARKFVTLAYKPVGPGAHTGKAHEWEMVYHRGWKKRKDAKARAIALYRKHSPDWSAKHPGKLYGEKE